MLKPFSTFSTWFGIKKKKSEYVRNESISA